MTHIRWADLSILFATTAMPAAIFWWLPRMRRGRLYFGVTAPDGFHESPEGTRQAANYRRLVLAGTLLTLAIGALAIESRSGPVADAVPLLQVAVCLGAWIWTWSRAKRVAAPPVSERVAGLAEDDEPQTLWLIAAAAPMLLMAAAALHMYSTFDSLPLKYPTHWNASGVADGFAHRSWRSVFGAGFIGAGVITLLLINVWMLLNWARRGPGGRGSWNARFIRANLRMLVTIAWAVGFIFSCILVTPALPSNWSGGMMVAIFLLPSFLIALAMFPLMKLSEEPTNESDHTPDVFWKLGVLYYNPEDPALLVPKRDGLGYSLNFGHGRVWMVVAAMVLCVAGPILRVLVGL